MFLKIKNIFNSLSTFIKENKDLSLIVVTFAIVSVSMIYQKYCEYKRVEIVNAHKIKLLQNQISDLTNEKIKLTEEMFKLKQKALVASTKTDLTPLSNESFLSPTASDTINVVAILGFLLISFVMFAYLNEITTKLVVQQKINHNFITIAKGNCQSIQNLNNRVSEVVLNIEKNSLNTSNVKDPLEPVMNQCINSNTLDSTLNTTLLDILTKLQLVEEQIEKMNKNLIELGVDVITNNPNTVSTLLETSSTLPPL